MLNLLTPVKRLTHIALTGLLASDDPERNDSVSAFGELTSPFAMRTMKDIMFTDRTGRRILKNQPLITNELLELARTMPKGSLGKSYATFMDVNGFEPNGRSPVTLINDPLEAYVFTRYRQSHDFVHSTMLAGRTIEEELAIKIVEFHHTRLPLGFFSVFGGLPHLYPADRDRVLFTYTKWAAEQSPFKSTHQRPIKNLLCVYWEELLHLPHKEVLKMLGWKIKPGPSSIPITLD